MILLIMKVSGVKKGPMKTNQIVFCVILIAVAASIWVIADWYPDKGLIAIAIMAFLGLLLGLINLFRPFSSNGTAKQCDHDLLQHAVKRAGQANADRTAEAAT